MEATHGKRGAHPSPDVIAAIRAFITPIWWNVHRSDLAWNVTDEMPSVASQAMCRHACAFMRRMAIDADRRDGIPLRSAHALTAAWRIVKGQIDPDGLPRTPTYLRRDATHLAVLVSDGRIVDLTADQFGLDPLAPMPWNRLFRTEPTAGDPGLSGSARTWAADPTYPALLAKIDTRPSPPQTNRSEPGACAP